MPPKELGLQCARPWQVGVNLQKIRIVEVQGIEKYCYQTNIQTGINWAFAVTWNTSMIAFLGLR